RAEAGEAALASDGDLEPQLLIDLIARLRKQDLSAVDCFSAIAPQLQRCLGQSYALMRDHMDNLRFNDAVKVLEGRQTR
ncbi:MAG TPA: hypothetical protein VKO16_00790, partial [Polyangia bacterium]|nr:hypothetical protein [Polyangia bacterium]